MTCPICFDDMVVAQATNFGAEYHYCRTCKKELSELVVLEQKPKDSDLCSTCGLDYKTIGHDLSKVPYECNNEPRNTGTYIKPSRYCGPGNHRWDYTTNTCNICGVSRYLVHGSSSNRTSALQLQVPANYQPFYFSDGVGAAGSNGTAAGVAYNSLAESTRCPNPDGLSLHSHYFPTMAGKCQCGKLQ